MNYITCGCCGVECQSIDDVCDKCFSWAAVTIRKLSKVKMYKEFINK